MSERSSRKKFINKLKNKYRLIVYNDTTLEQVWYMRISRLTILSVFIPLLLVLVALIVVVIAFTPIREWIPGYPDENTRRQIVYTAMKADSLENVMISWDRYLDNVSDILTGKEPAPIEITPPDTLLGRQSRSNLLSHNDSLFRAQVEREEQFRLLVQSQDNQAFENMFFYPPLKGAVVTPFSTSESHFGVDVEADPNATVTSVLDGTVISAFWTLDEGYTIIVQHTENLLSIYRQVARVLKKTGDRVASGEVIAFLGKPAEGRSKADLHFELWHNGAPVNPSIYIAF